MARAGVFISVVGDASQAVKSFEQAKRELEKLAGSSRSISDRFRDAGKRLSEVGRRMTRTVTLPIVGLGAASVKAFADFDAAMTQSTAIMGNLAPEIRKEMETTARSVAKTTVFSAKEAAESYFFLASAGLDAAASIRAMPQVASFAQAGMFDMARATDLLTDAQSALGLTVRNDAVKNLENMTRVSDVLVKANILANASVEQFSESLTNKAGAALRAVGKDVEEGAAVLAAFADQGVKGAESGEALNIVLRDLQRAAIKKADAFKSAGIAVFDSSGEMRNMADIIGDLEARLEGMSDKQKRAELTTLGFQDKSVSNLVTLLGTSEAIRGYEKALRDAGNTTADVAKKQLQTPAQRLKLLKDNITDVAISLGEVLIPFVERAAQFVGRLVERFRDLSPSTKRFVLIAAGLAAVIGPVLTVLGGLATAIAAIASPVGAVILGIAALAAAFVVAYNKSETFRQIVTDVVANVQQLWERFGPIVMSIVKTVFGFIVRTIQNVARVIGGIIQVISGVLTGDWRKAWEGLKNIVGAVWDQMVNVVKTRLLLVRDVFKLVWSAIKNGVISGVQFVVDKFLAMAEWIIRGAAKAFGWVPGIGGKLKTAAKEFEKFRDNVNASLEGIKDRNVTVTAGLNITEDAERRRFGGGKKFHSGGIVPGPASREMVALVRGGEQITTPEQRRRGTSSAPITINVNGAKTEAADIVAELDWYYRSKGIA